MNLLGHYLLLKHAHVTFVTLSVVLFTLRGIAVLAHRTWPMRPTPRWASVVIDTLLLATGVSLWIALGLNPLRETWLGAKLVLLVAYIVLGSMALKRSRTRIGRGFFFVAALLCVGFMVSVAVEHDPRGVFAHEMRWSAASNALEESK